MKRKISNFFRKKGVYIYIGILYIITAIFIYSLIRLNVLNIGYLLLVIGIICGLDIFLTFKFLRKKTRKVPKIIFTIISIILIIIEIVGIIYINTTSNFLKKITTKDKEYRTYSVLVLKKSDYEKINDLDSKKILFLEDNYDDSVEGLKKSAHINFESDKEKDVNNQIDKLESKDSDAIVMDKSLLSLLDENNHEDFEKLKEIYSYKVEIKETKKQTDSNKFSATDGFILYISGIDSRGGLAETSRSDVNIIAAVNTKTRNVLLIHIPRDYYVHVSGTPENAINDKLTHVGLYGVDRSAETIGDLLGINIDYTLKVGFNTLISSVDIINGIDIYSDINFTSYTNSNCSFHTGTQHVNGTCALAFSRERYAYSDGDIQRGRNQEQVISRIIDKVTNIAYLTKYTEILNALNGSFETTMSYDDITSLVKRQISNGGSWTTDSYNLTGTGSMNATYTAGSQLLYVMIPDENTLKEALEKIKAMY